MQSFVFDVWRERLFNDPFWVDVPVNAARNVMQTQHKHIPVRDPDHI